MKKKNKKRYRCCDVQLLNPETSPEPHQALFSFIHPFSRPEKNASASGQHQKNEIKNGGK